jgi:hypothetical protein
MKRISFIVLLASAATAFSISSCDKDELVRSVDGSVINTALAPYTIDLVANQWNKIVTGVYTCSFKNIIPPGYRSSNGTVKVYLLKSDQKILIDYPINFMGGELSAITNSSDVTINYRCYNQLPFVYLNIKVEINQ